MKELTLKQLAEKMKGIDIAMLSTITDAGWIAGCPMSNNGEVDYDGTSYYFTFDQSRTVADIRRNDKVSLAFQGTQSKSFSVSVEGKAKLVEDKKQMADHWTPDLDRWFKDGLDTPGIVMIQVDAKRIHYWAGEDDGEVKV